MLDNSPKFSFALLIMEVSGLEETLLTLALAYVIISTIDRDKRVRAAEMSADFFYS